MKNLKTPMALAILLAAAPAAYAADLTISGEVMETTCTAAINGGADVKMAKVDMEELKTADRVGGQDVNVTISCPGASGSEEVAVKFTQTLSTPDGGLTLTPTSVAKGVSYKIYDEGGQQLRVNAMPTRFVTVDGTSSQTLKHTVWYAKSGAAADVEAGSANATAQMDIVYK